MLERLRELVKGRKTAIVGFGLEGRSTYRFLRQRFPGLPLAVADRDPMIAANTAEEVPAGDVEWITGEDYLDRLDGYDLIIKSPGIALPEAYRQARPGLSVTSQTALLLEEFRTQVIGVTGTKGKSTTSSLIHHILVTAGRKSILAGNIGNPPLDDIHHVAPGSWIVCEMSSHQLEDLRLSPRIAVLLNLYPEHLDRYAGKEEYFRAKWNIFLHQAEEDVRIVNDAIDPDDLPPGMESLPGKMFRYGPGIKDIPGCYLEKGHVTVVDRSGKHECCLLDETLFLKGEHNRMNMLAAILAAREVGLDHREIMNGIRTFHGLEHRLEYVGQYRGIHFYNDSIATIPEATMAALRAIENVDTLILGGYDRHLDYTELIDFLMDSGVSNLIFMGKAGERMMQQAMAHEKCVLHRLFKADSMEEAFRIIPRVTEPGKVCLLSPAAASYDRFKNFEERGRLFKRTARNL